MKSPLIVDAHEDIAYNALALGRDFRRSAQAARAREGTDPRGGGATTSLPDLLRGNVRVVFGTLYVAPASAEHALPGPVYTTPAEAETLAREQIAYYEGLAADSNVVLIRTRADLERVLDATDPCLGLVLLMEGADPIVRPEDASSWFEAGVRIVGPAWHATRYAGGTGAPGPLTKPGRALMPELERAGLILDSSHLAEASFFEALDLFGGAVIASHSNARALVPTDRQLSDEMVRAILARDGVIGAVLFNQFLRAGWRETGAHKEAVTLSDVVRHLRYMCELAGDARHVGLGSDFDGGFGYESIPRELDTVADLPRLADALADSNFGDDDIANILGGNWLRLLRRALPAGKPPSG